MCAGSASRTSLSNEGPLWFPAMRAVYTEGAPSRVRIARTRRKSIFMRRSFSAVILAAGQGTRMKSALPKVLFRAAGVAMLDHVVRAAHDAGAGPIVVVVGHGREEVEDHLRSRFGERVSIAVQSEQKGTGHAVQCALPALEGVEGDVVILCGDVPLLEAEAITRLLRAREEDPGAKVAFLTAELPDPTGYGRILRSESGRVLGIREHKDASAAERAIKEWNAGVYAVEARFLRHALSQLKTENAQGELYLTDVVAMASTEGGAHGIPWHAESVMGVNDRAQLAVVEHVLRRRIVGALARSGVTVRDLSSVFVDADVVVEPEVTLEPGVHLRGKTVVRTGARIDVGAVLTDVVVESGAYLKPYTVAEKSKIGPRAQIGPFSHLRPETELGEDTHIGNFVETKKTTMGRGSKANHLAYLGDGQIGEGVNVGAGTIFCNYDGFRKHTTILEDGAFIGSDSQLVAPITIGKGAYVGTGTTVTRNVPADALAISRVKQENKEGYASRLKDRMKALAAAEKAKK
jgi:bifunctional UDP-N-acetylglucosamine pyrophosphorylase/glucosamine-1-phosphate N-acetyltransferase